MVQPEPGRILWLTEHYVPGKGGMAQSCDRIVSGLRGAGLAVDLVHFRPGHDLDEPGDWEPRLGGRELPCPLGDHPEHQLNLLWRRLEAEPEAWTKVVAFGGVMALLSAPAFAAWLDRPLVVCLRGNDFDSAVFHPRRSELVFRALARAATVCPVTREMAAKVRPFAPQARIVWTPSGIDPDDWQAIADDHQRAADWRAHHSPDRPVLGLFGQLKAKKGGLLLLEALERSGRLETVTLLVVGDLEGTMRDALLALSPRLRFAAEPFVDHYQLIPRYLACDFVALPSFYDGLPNVLLEAAALGVPLIATRAAGMADLLQNGVHGTTFPPGDREEAAIAIATALDAPADTREEWRRNVLAIAAEYSAAAETRRYLDVLRA